MVGSSRKLLVVGAVVMLGCLFMASQAEACWGWGSCYPTASYYTPYVSWCGPCYTSCYTPCYSYCGYGYYPYRRCMLGSYRWYYAGCCNTCYSSPCCCTTVVDSCCGATVEGTTTEGTTVAPSKEQQPTLAEPQQNATPPAEGAAPPQMNESVQVPTRQTSGLLTVWVPANAKVFINGKETTTAGSRRRYVSYGLKPGLTYKYEIRAELVRNGMIAEDTKTVYLTAGAAEGVAFGFNRKPTNQVAQSQ